MVKSLFLIRHAEALEATGGLKDKERDLSPKGYRDASRIGRYLFEKSIHPDMIVCSDAQRAHATSELLAEQMKFELHKIQYSEELYNASVRTLLSTIHDFDPDWKQVVLIGHNPAISYLSEYLTGEHIDTMAPAGMVHLEFRVSKWGEVDKDTGQLIEYMMPENIIF